MIFQSRKMFIFGVGLSWSLLSLGQAFGGKHLSSSFIPGIEPEKVKAAPKVEEARLHYDERRETYYFEEQLAQLEAQRYLAPESPIRDDGLAFAQKLTEPHKDSVLVYDRPSPVPVLGGTLLGALAGAYYSEDKAAGLISGGLLGFLGSSLCSYKKFDDTDERLLTDKDRRAPVEDDVVTTWPWRVHGHLELAFVYPNGSLKTYIGSGTLVGSKHVLTAGHNLFDNGFDKNGVKRPGLVADVQSVRFYPGQAGKNIPWQAKGVQFVLHPQYKKARTKAESFESDMGMVILDEPLGDKLGYFGLRTLEDSEKPDVTIAGYPGSPGGGNYMYTMKGPIANHSPNKTRYNIDTTGGQSGSGVWTEGLDCVAVHTHGSKPYNGGTRLHDQHADLVKDWLKQGG